MKTIRTDWFDDIKNANDPWGVISDINEKSDIFPELIGGLDHIDIKPRGIYIHDIGCNGQDNSFVIRPIFQEVKMKLGNIRHGFRMQTTFGLGYIHPKRYRLFETETEKGIAISFKLRGGWMPWRTLKK